MRALHAWVVAPRLFQDPTLPDNCSTTQLVDSSTTQLDRLLHNPAWRLLHDLTSLDTDRLTTSTINIRGVPRSVPDSKHTNRATIKTTQKKRGEREGSLLWCASLTLWRGEKNEAGTALQSTSLRVQPMEWRRQWGRCSCKCYASHSFSFCLWHCRGERDRE
jgi:hypothetical protein